TLGCAAAAVGLSKQARATDWVVHVGIAGLFNAVGFTAALLCLVPEYRRMLAAKLPLDPRSPVQAVALSLVAGVTVMSFGQLVATGAHPVLLTMAKTHPELVDRTPREQLLSMVFMLLWTVSGAVVAVGW